MRTLLVLPLALLATAAVLGPAEGANPCPERPERTYVTWNVHVHGAFDDSASVHAHYPLHVWSTNLLADCNPQDGVPGDWTGDYDQGIGTAFFGHGAWVHDPECDYQLHAYGPNVHVEDLVLGGNVQFLVGEDDYDGPIKLQDLVTSEWYCETSGSITPCPSPDPASCGPMDDIDDCISDADAGTPGYQPFVGSGSTCHEGGGDGGYWVMVLPPATAGTVKASW